MTDTIEKPTTKRASTKTVEPEAEGLPRNIIAIIPLIRTELGAISKDDEPTAGTKFKYRGHDEIVNKIVPLFNKYGVFTTVEDESVYYGGREAAGAKYQTAAVIRKAVRFYGPDGEYVTSTVIAESLDMGNKSTTQAQTYAYRIALTQTFTIPTGDPDPDSNAEDAPGAARTAPAAPPAQPKPTTAAPATEDELTPLRESIKAHLVAHGIEGKDPVLAEGKAFFNGREGFWANRAALTKWDNSLKSGEIPKTATN
jgi:hypothetical protein